MPITPNVYQIYQEHHELEGLNTLEIIETIVNKGRKKLQFDKIFDPNELSTFQRDDFTYHLFLMNTAEHESDWSEFLPEELTADNDFTQQKLSLILFIETEFQLYVVVGGSAYKLIISYIDHSFGITAYDRIVEPDKDELTSPHTWYYRSTHRHISHLYALYPGSLITTDGTPELAEACRKTLVARGDDGPSWSIVYRQLFWARLHDGNHAYLLLKQLMRVNDKTDINYTAGGGSILTCFHQALRSRSTVTLAKQRR